MSYHIVSIDAPSCSLSCRDGQLLCRTEQGERSLPLEDVAVIVITSFSASIHSHLLIEAAKQGIGLILCDAFKPSSLVLPTNRSTDTALSRALLTLDARVRDALWRRTVDAKCQNQFAMATAIAAKDDRVPALECRAMSKAPHKEATCARLFWNVIGRSLEEDGFRRVTRNGTGINALLNYGYAVLLSSILQKLFSVGLDPTWGLSHRSRERATPLAYDLMEPFRPCVDLRVWQWIKSQSDSHEWGVSKAYRAWIIGFLLERVRYRGYTLDVRSVIEGVVRSFRHAVLANAVRPYRPWMPKAGEWPVKQDYGPGALQNGLDARGF